MGIRKIKQEPLIEYYILNIYLQTNSLTCKDSYMLKLKPRHACKVKR